MRRRATSRRDLLALGMLATASICGGCALFGSRTPDVATEPRPEAIRLSKAQSLTLLESQGSLLLQPEGTKEKMIVVHSRDGSLHALSAICTRMGCTVNYRPEVDHIVCPCDGSEYALDGSNLKGSAKRPLKRYDVAVEDGQVVIRG